jgi:hypothetical protein
MAPFSSKNSRDRQPQEDQSAVPIMTALAQIRDPRTGLCDDAGPPPFETKVDSIQRSFRIFGNAGSRHSQGCALPTQTSFTGRYQLGSSMLPALIPTNSRRPELNA